MRRDDLFSWRRAGALALGLLLAALGYATVQLLWLAPALQRKRRLARNVGHAQETG